MKRMAAWWISTREGESRYGSDAMMREVRKITIIVEGYAITNDGEERSPYHVIANTVIETGPVCGSIVYPQDYAMMMAIGGNAFAGGKVLPLMWFQIPFLYGEMLPETKEVTDASNRPGTEVAPNGPR
jgi:hypothetical protein